MSASLTKASIFGLVLRTAEYSCLSRCRWDLIATEPCSAGAQSLGGWQGGVLLEDLGEGLGALGLRNFR